MVEIADIDSRETLEDWLKDKPVAWAQLIALRSALRVWPLTINPLDIPSYMGQRPHEGSLLVNSWRANFLSALACTWLCDDVRRASMFSNVVEDAAFAVQYVFGFADTANDAVAAGEVTAHAAFCSHKFIRSNMVSGTAANASPTVATDAANAAFADSVYGADAASAAAWETVRAECRILSDDGPDALASMPLWIMWADDGEGITTVTPPKAVTAAMDRLPDLTQIFGPNASLFAAWYEAHFNGGKRLFTDERARDLALKADGFWQFGDEKGARALVDRIAEQLGWPGQYVGQDDAADEVAIAPQKPATLEPEWSDERLILPARPLPDDFKEGDMNDALQALKTVLEGFSADVSGSNNIDQRIVRYLSDLAHSAPVQVPDQAEFFVFAHNETVLSGLVPTAEREWDGLLASRLAAISLQFADTVRKFPAWRAFRRSVPDDGMSPEDVAAAEELSHVLAEALRADFAAEFVDRVIPDTLDDIADDIPDVEPVTADDRLVTEQTRAQTHDLLESINNILKPIMAGALWAKGKAGELGAVTWERLSKGIRAEYGDQIEKLARQVVKLGFGLLKYGVPTGAAAAFGGKPLVVWLLSAFPSYFKWLEPVAKILGVVG